MRSIYCQPLEQSVSALGFGCASLGSRIAPKEGLRALATAYDRGVRWFDVAPPYGDGKAEQLLGTFLKGRRDQAIICSKVGIERPQISPQKVLLRSILRPVVKAVPSIRGIIARSRGNVRQPINASDIENSVIISLEALGTDYLDVLALHEPTPLEVSDPAIIDVLGTLKSKGLVRVFSIAGAPDSIAAGRGSNFDFAMGQCPDNPFENNLRKFLDGPPMFLLSHSVLGSGVLERFTTLYHKSSALSSVLSDAGYGEDSLADALVDYAFANNVDGVVLASMYSQGHIINNTDRATRLPNPELVKLIDLAISEAGV